MSVQQSATVLVFGSVNIDLVACVEAIPRPGETVLAQRYETLFGGKGANQAVAASRALGGPPGRVTMIGRVGSDSFGEAALGNLAANGIAVEMVRRSEVSTGCAFITVDDRGENAITVAVGANATVAADDVGDTDIAQARVLVLQMEVPVEQSLAVATRARASGVCIIWNLAPVPPALDGGLCRRIAAVTDILIVNEHEAVAFAAAIGAPAADYGTAAANIAANGVRTVVVTAGAAGALAVHRDGRRATAAALAVTPVDTTGAGDTFVGVFAAGMAEGRSFEEALARGCRGASLACMTMGAQAGMPSRTDLGD
jgi:ribokinase